MSEEKMNIFLDLDNTILSSEESNNITTLNNYKTYYKFDPYVIFPRPHLDKFLDFIFNNFNVSIWTAASKEYALFVIKNIIIKDYKNRHIDTILYQENSDHVKYKDLTWLWKKWNCKKFTIYNTIIIDDLPEVCGKNKNSYHIKYFDYKDINDNELEKLIDILTKRYL